VTPDDIGKGHRTDSCREGAVSDQAYMFGWGVLAIVVVLNVVVIRVALWPIQARLDRVITELELWRYQREDDDSERRQSALYEDLGN